jgi:hypothetical protein
MKFKKEGKSQVPEKTRDTLISKKFQKIVTDIKESGYANLSRLTVLKKWFEMPNRVSSFGIFIALEASRRECKTTEEEGILFREAKQILENADIFEAHIPRASAKRLLDRLLAFQNERRNAQWTSLRIIKNMNLFLIEGGIGLYLSSGNSASDGYRLAASYCERYDPRYGNGLNDRSIKRIEEIAGFVLAIEAHEEKNSKLCF